MSQSDSTYTTTQAILGNVQAIRRPRHAATLPAVQLAHAAMIGALAQLTPHDIRYGADRFDIMERRDHLDDINAIVLTYNRAIVADTQDMAPIGYVKDETGYLKDAASEIYGALDNAVERMMEDQADAAE